MKFTVLVPFLRRLFHIRRAKHSFESPRYLLKWLLISTLIGIVAGVGAIAFYAAIHFATGIFLGQIVGYYVESGAPVLDEQGNLQGVLTLFDIQQVPLAERQKQSIGSIVNHDVLTVYSDDTLDEALEQLTAHRVSWAPVVDVEGLSGGVCVIGVLSAKNIVQLYRETLAKDSRRMRGLVEGTVMVEAKIEPGMRLVGIPLREAQLPAECLVVSIRRDGELLFPRGSAAILAGDAVTFLVSPRGEEHLQQYLEARTKSAEPIPLG